MAIERKNYSELGTPVGPYVHAVKHGDSLYLSGLTAFGSKAQGQSVARQARAIFEQLRTIVAAEGTELDALVKVTIFITSFEAVAELREVLLAEYGTSLPASSLVAVAGLFSPEVNVEIEAILALPNT